MGLTRMSGEDLREQLGRFFKRGLAGCRTVKDSCPGLCSGFLHRFAQQRSRFRSLILHEVLSPKPYGCGSRTPGDAFTGCKYLPVYHPDHPKLQGLLDNRW